MMGHREETLRAALLEWSRQPADEAGFAKLLELRDEAAEVAVRAETRESQLQALLAAADELRAAPHPNGQVHPNGKHPAPRERRMRPAYLWLGAAAAAVVLLALALLLPHLQTGPQMAGGPETPVAPRAPGQVESPPPILPGVLPELLPEPERAPVVRGSEEPPVRPPSRPLGPNPGPRRDAQRRPAPQLPDAAVPPTAAPLTELGYVAAAVGEPTIQNGDDAAEVVMIQQKLYPGMRVSTGDIDRLELRLFDRVTVRLDFNTEIVIPRDERDQIEMRSGQIWASVETMPAGRTFAVETPVATATVLGTKFDLELQGEKPATMKAILRVEEGLVRFGNEFGSVRAGEKTETSAAAGSKPLEPKRVEVLATGFVPTQVPGSLSWQINNNPLTVRQALTFLDYRLKERGFQTLPILRRWALNEASGSGSTDGQKLPVVSSVAYGGPAARAGLQVGDVLLARDGLASGDDGRFTGTPSERTRYLVYRHGEQFELVIPAGVLNEELYTLDENSPLWEVMAKVHELVQASNLSEAVALLKEAGKTSDHPAIDASLGVIFQLEEKYSLAAAHFRRAMGKASGNGRYRFLYAQLVRAVGNIDRALEYAHQAHQLAPQWQIPLLFLGHTYQANGDAVSEELVRKAFVEAQPDNYSSYFELADFYARQGNPAEAMKILREGLSRLPNAAMLHVKASEILVWQGKPEEALPHGEAAVKIIPTALNIEAYVGPLRALGRLDEALEWGKRGVDLFPGSATSHSTLGRTYHAAERYEEALSAYLKASELQPNNLATLSNIVAAHYGLNRRMEAVPYAERAYQLGSRSAPVLALRANVAAIEGRFEEALILLRQAQEREDNATISMELARVYAAMGNWKKAELEARLALERGSRTEIAFMSLAAALDNQQRRSESIQALQDGVKTATTTVWIRLDLTRILLEEGRLEEAVQLSTQLREEYPNDGPTVTLDGLTRLSTGQIEAARIVLKRALELEEEALAPGKRIGSVFESPSHHLVTYRLAEAFEQLAMVSEARKSYELVLKRDPTYEPAKAALARLR
jgi:tetratricopeptide (TPR) repeat protein/ferric-dicitrate binding protein FerR (iron transport regulator)